MLGLRQRTSCRQKYKKLQIVTVPMLHILATVMFVIKNSDKYQTNVSNHSRICSVQKGVCYSSIRIFNKLPPHNVQQHENTMAFNNLLKISHK